MPENSIVQISGSSVTVKEYRGKRVVTFKEIDAVHQRPEGTARKRFNENKDRFLLGEDYFVRKTDEAQTEYGITAPNGLTLITESGYLMLVKSFTDDLAWRVQRELVNSYFRTTSAAPPKPMTLAEQLLQYAQVAVEQERKVNALAARMDAQQQTLEKAVSVFSLPTVEVEHWRDEMNTHVSRICETYGLSQQVFRGDTYAELEEQANVILSSRVKRKQERMKKAGAKARERAAVTKLFVISEDEKLRHMYEAIVRKHESQLCVQSSRPPRAS